MNLSANSLFHFTNNIDAIKSILNDKFYGSYCKEVLYHKDEKLPLFIPMISFCDTRLETIYRFPKYGKYGLGLSKNWGIKNKLNPVFYLEKQSLLASSLIKSFYSAFVSVMTDQQQIDQISQKIKRINELGHRDNFSKQQIVTKLKKDLIILKSKAGTLEHLVYSLYYTKHYQADLERENEITENYRFYDEREWRYMPEFECAVCQLRITEDEYLEWRGSGEKKPLLPKINLSFAFTDVEYIIVEKENEIKEMIEHIKQINVDKCDQEQKERLLTKITSYEKIENDY